MPRTDRKITCVSQEMQIRASSWDWPKSLVWKSPPGRIQSQKLQQRRLGPFTETKRITNTTYQIQEGKDPAILKTFHRNHLVEYYPKEESLLPMIEEYVPSGKSHDDFYERFMERRVQRLKNTTENTSADSIPFPIVPLSSTPNVLPTKRISNTSEDSGVNSSPTFSPTIASHPINYPPGTPSLKPSTSHTITPQFRLASHLLLLNDWFILIQGSIRIRSPNIIVLKQIILAQNQYCALEHAKAIDSKT